ncbi:MAG: hypothetical protein ACRED5_12665, partial [Propylenella sp.]
KGDLPPRGAALLRAFDEFSQAYPRRRGSDPSKPARRAFEAAVKGGADPAAIIAAARRYADEQHSLGHVDSELVCQRATWLRQQRWKDYTALPAAASNGAKFVRRDSPDWDRHAEAYRDKHGKHPPEVNGGWYFEGPAGARRARANLSKMSEERPSPKGEPNRARAQEWCPGGTILPRDAQRSRAAHVQHVTGAS